MIDSKLDIIRGTVAEGTGAEISINSDKNNFRVAVNIWFSDLKRSRGPYINFGPTGLKRHAVKLAFGNFSAPVLKQIAAAELEEIQLSRALLTSIDDDVAVHLPEGMNYENWIVDGPNFSITAEKRNIDDYLSNDALEKTCSDIVVPIMAAMAELIGYDEIILEENNDEPAWEGAEKRSVIKRRERNPRNRLLCLRIHGGKCKICEFNPTDHYGESGSIIEVHHLEPLSTLCTARKYDPKIDLIPLCPNCHRAIHTRRPAPWTPKEIQEMLECE